MTAELFSSGLWSYYAHVPPHYFNCNFLIEFGFKWWRFVISQFQLCISAWSGSSVSGYMNPSIVVEAWWRKPFGTVFIAASSAMLLVYYEFVSCDSVLGCSSVFILRMIVIGKQLIFLFCCNSVLLPILVAFRIRMSDWEKFVCYVPFTLIILERLLWRISHDCKIAEL